MNTWVINEALRRDAVLRASWAKSGIFSRRVEERSPKPGGFRYVEIDYAEVDRNKRAAAVRLLEHLVNWVRRSEAAGQKPFRGIGWASRVGIQFIREARAGDLRPATCSCASAGFIYVKEPTTLYVRADVPFEEIERTIPHEFHHQLMAGKYAPPVTEEEILYWEVRANTWTADRLKELNEDDGYRRLRFLLNNPKAARAEAN